MNREKHVNGTDDGKQKKGWWPLGMDRAKLV